MSAIGEQRTGALSNANVVRKRRKDFHSELREGGRHEGPMILADAITTVPDWLSSIAIHELLQWCPGLGSGTVTQWLARAQIIDRRSLGPGAPHGLRPISERQRVLLSELLTARAQGKRGEGAA